MNNFDARRQASIGFGHIRSLMRRLKKLHLTPLAAILLVGLSIMTLVAGLFALRAILGPSGLEESVVVPEWKPPTLAIVPLDPPKLASADIESLSRPIFSKSRKPAPKTTAPIATYAAAADGISLTAIIRNNKTARAFFISADAPEGQWRKIGETVESWMVEKIASTEVVLQNGTQKVIFKLYTGVTTPSGGPPLP